MKEGLSENYLKIECELHSYLKVQEDLNEFILINHKTDRNTIGPVLYKPVLVWILCNNFSQHPWHQL